MANSSTVAAGDAMAATQYNNLRKDVLDTSSGHAHTGSDSKAIALLGSHQHTGSDGTVVAAPPSSSAVLAADVTLTTAGTWYSVLTLTLAAGTWVVSAHALFGSPNGYYLGYLRLDNSSATYYASTDQPGYAGGAASYWSASLETVIVLAGSTTVRLAATAGTNGDKVKAALGVNGVGNNATQLIAVKIA